MAMAMASLVFLNSAQLHPRHLSSSSSCTSTVARGCTLSSPVRLNVVLPKKHSLQLQTKRISSSSHPFLRGSMLKMRMSVENGTNQTADDCTLNQYSLSLVKNLKKNTYSMQSKCLTSVQCILSDLMKQTVQIYLHLRTLQLHLLEIEFLKYFTAEWWLNLIPSVRVKTKTNFIVMVSILAGMLLVVGAPANSPNSATWALTQENLIFLEAWRTIDRAYVDKTFNGQSWFRYREEALRREPMNNREETCPCIAEQSRSVYRHSVDYCYNDVAYIVTRKPVNIDNEYTAIRKMLATLGDPFTRFLEPDKFNSLRTGTRGAVTGVGLEVGFDMSDKMDPNLTVIAPVIGGPAERAGILPGDVITEIDGVSTKGIGLYDAAQRLQGPESSEIKLTIQKQGSESPRTILLTREKININPVSWRLCEVADEGQNPVKIGYIRLATFNENASRSVRDAILKLKEQGATAYILDMRNNRLDKGVIVYIADSMGVRDIYEADGLEAIATSEPLAVLVNKGTASASEILAGALKDNKRAVILGEPTFGKGKIQSVFQLSDGSGMAVTVARYETPSHIDIDKVGIIPDHTLPAFIPLDKDEFCKCLVDPSLACHIPSSKFFSK